MLPIYKITPFGQHPQRYGDANFLLVNDSVKFVSRRVTCGTKYMYYMKNIVYIIYVNKKVKCIVSQFLLQASPQFTLFTIQQKRTTVLRDTILSLLQPLSAARFVSCRTSSVVCTVHCQEARSRLHGQSVRAVCCLYE